MIDFIDSFHKPDPIWKVWGVNSHQEFLKKFMVEGKFHLKVSKDIVNEYKIVERLICYSYYSYGLIDEAFSKVLRIFEGAVKTRMQELGIEVGNKNENLKRRLGKLEKYTSPELFKQWDKAREVRNIFAHPTSGQLFGITVHRSFLQMVNILNTLFIDKKNIDANESILKRIKSETEPLKNGLFKLEMDDKAYLVWSIIPYSVFDKTDQLNSLWVFHPVLTYFPQTIDKSDFWPPIYLQLRDVSFTETELCAINLEDDKPIKASITDKIENRNLLKTHTKIVNSSDEKVKDKYYNFLDELLGYEIVKFLYYKCWS